MTVRTYVMVIDCTINTTQIYKASPLGLCVTLSVRPVLHFGNDGSCSVQSVKYIAFFSFKCARISSGVVLIRQCVYCDY